MKKEVPFYTQQWDLSQWYKLGFDNYEDAAYWEKSSCGVLCLKMAIDAGLQNHGKSFSPSVAEYIKKGVALGAYTDSVGWSHDGIVRLAEAFGFLAVVRSGVRSTDLHDALKEDFLPIISIKSAFEIQKSLKERLLFWKKFGGHLALAVGYRCEGEKIEGFYVHHTSLLPEYNWQYRFVPIEKFEQVFTGRCILLKT